MVGIMPPPTSASNIVMGIELHRQREVAYFWG
jgi:hypothetical protein